MGSFNSLKIKEYHLFQYFLFLFLFLVDGQLQARNVDVKVEKIIVDEEHLNYVVRAKIYPDDPNHLYLTSRGEDELGNNGRLSIYDISKPASPVLVTSWKPPLIDADQSCLVSTELFRNNLKLPISSGQCQTLVQARALPYIKNVLEGQDKSNNILVVLSIYTGDVHLLDVSNPADIKRVGSVTIGGTITIPYMKILHVKVFHSTGKRTYAIITAPQSHSLIAVDITDPAKPVQVASVDLGYIPIPNKEGAEGVFLYGQYAYCGAFNGSKMVIVDLSKIDQHQLTVVNTLENATYNQLVSTMDTRPDDSSILYSASWSNPGGLIVFDLDAPSSPKEISYVIKAELSKANRVKLWNNFAFMPHETEPGIVSIIDVTNPHAPALVKVIPGIKDGKGQVINKPYAMAIKGNYAYVFGAPGSNMAILSLSETN